MELFMLLTIFLVNDFLAVEGKTVSDPSEYNSIKSDWKAGKENPLMRIEYYPQPGESDGNLTSFNGTKLRRSIRSPKKGCEIPENLSESRLDCTVYPSKVVCKQTCIFGHTLPDGNSRQMKCKYDEDKWEPVPEFEKCQPFVDCGVTLGPGGVFKCTTNYMNQPPSCDISCQKYEDKKAVPKKTYRCNIKGKWTPKLPFCAKAGSGIKVVAPPKTTEFEYGDQNVRMDEPQDDEGDYD